MRIVREMLASDLAFVPRRLELSQHPDHAMSPVDRIGAGAHDAHVNGMSAHFDLEPEHADIGAHELLVLRLGDQRGVGAITAQMRHEGAVARRFLLDHALQVNGGRGLQADAPQGVEREEIGGMARLHVGAAASEQPIA